MPVKPRRPTAILAALAVLAAPAPAVAGPTLYAGVAGGYGAQAIDQDPIVIPPIIIGPGQEIPGQTLRRDIEGTDLALQGFVGVRLHRHLALEAGYVDLGEVDDINPFVTEGGQLAQVAEGVATTAFEGMIVGVWPLSRDLELFGKVGVVNWEADRRVDGVITGRPDGSDIAYGLGVDFTGTGRVRFRVQGMQYNLDGFDESIAVTAAVYYALPLGR